MFGRTEPLRAAILEALPERPFHVALWDGSRVPSSSGDGPTFLIRSPRAIAHVLRSPGELGIGRAYVTGALDVDDLDAAMRLVDEREAAEIAIRGGLRLMAAGVMAMGLVRPPRRPASELVLRGRRHTLT